jgi:hypothetical protein
MPHDTAAPFLLTIALSVVFVGLILVLWPLVAAGLMLSAASMLVWLWPRRELREREVLHG